MPETSAFRLGCMTLPYAKQPFARALEGIARAGYGAVALWPVHEGNAAFDPERPGEAARLAAQLRRHGLQPVMLVGTQYLEPAQPLARAERALAFAAEAGIPEVLTLGVWGYRRFPDEPLSSAEMAPKHAAFVERLRALAPTAARLGVTITLKPHTGDTATGPILANTLVEIDSPQVCASYDPGNVRFYEGVAPEEDIEPLLASGPSSAPRLFSLIAKDHRGARAEADFPIPGEGEIDFARLFARLREAGYSGPVVVERADGRDRAPLAPEELDRRLERARVNLERLIAGAG